MELYGISIPDKSLSNFDLIKYVKDLNIPNFRGVFMRDELPNKPWYHECGIVNFNTSTEPGSHWVAYYKNGKNRIYFDSYGQVILDEISKYLKSDSEKINDEAVIARNCEKFLSKYLFGYGKEYNCQIALVSMIERLKMSRDKREYSGAVLIVV